MKRSELKQLIKECLSEILQEGLGNVSAPLIQERAVAKPMHKPAQTMRRPGDVIRYGQAPKAQNEVFEHHVSQTVSTITEDPLLSSIFSDTAKTTLQNQNNGGHNAPSLGSVGAPMRGTAEHIASTIDPMEVFGDSAQNWAQIAFAPKK